MTTRVAFLRAVNVGRRTVRNARLVELFEELGFTHVWTHVNSGNVVIYTTDVERLADAGGLVPASTGANVILAEPYDPIVFARSTSTDGTSLVSTAQAAADLLTGPGRMPQEGEALVRWMHANVERWQAPRLD